MIRFACTCGHRFKVEDDQAGGWVQCPACRLLNDIPSLTELRSFTDDGIYKLDEGKSVVEDVDRMSDIKIVYSKTKIDEQGNEIDLRTLPAGHPRRPVSNDDIDDGSGEYQLNSTEPAEPDITQRPKYDPETGELVRPLDVVADPDRDADPAAIPMAMATISYAGGNLDKRITPLSLMWELFMPMNLVVMGFIIGAQMFSAVMFVVMIAALIYLAAPWIILQALVLAHYGNVVDSTGRSETDDLPRPLRDLEWIEDIWHPFVQMFGGILICFVVPTLTLLAIGHFARVPPAIAFVIGGMIGTFLGPAVLLTLTTSGSIANLRPDRVLGVMGACGGHYLGIVLLWAITWPIYTLGWVGFHAALTRSFGHEIVITWILDYMTGVEIDDTGIFGEWIVAFPALFLGIYLMHYFCWYLGLLYKGFYQGFPWVLQRHTRDPMDPRGTHADQIGRRRPRAGHLPPMDAQLPSAPPPPPQRSRVG